MALEVVGAIGSVTQGVARLLGLSKSARLRRAINDHVKLHASLGHDDLKQSAFHLAALIELQTRQLYLREVMAANRTYAWDQLAIGLVMAGICAVPLYLWFPPQSWWQWIADVFLGLLIFALLLTAASSFRKQPTLEELAAAAEQAESEAPSLAAAEQAESEAPSLAAADQAESEARSPVAP